MNVATPQTPDLTRLAAAIVSAVGEMIDSATTDQIAPYVAYELAGQLARSFGLPPPLLAPATVSGVNARQTSESREGVAPLPPDPAAVEEEVRRHLVAEAQQGTLSYLFELEGHLWPDADRGMETDANGLAYAGGMRYSLRQSDATVRVQIAPVAPREEVLALLRNLVAWIEEDPDRLDPERYAGQEG